MSIRVVYQKGTLTLDLHEILCCVEPEQKLEMLESLSCDDDVITFVTQQIIQRWTDNGYGGGSYVNCVSDPRLGLDKAWREVAKASGEIAKREIERLELSLERETQEANRLRNENYDLRRGVFHDR